MDIIIALLKNWFMGARMYSDKAAWESILWVVKGWS